MTTLAELSVLVGIDASNYKQGLASIEGDTERAGGRIGGFWSNAFSMVTGGLITKAIDGVTGSIGGLIDGMIGGNAQFEVYNTQFSVMLGSAEAAKDRMAELSAFGASTPFELPQVVEADKVLQGFGLHSQEAAKMFGFSGAEIRTIAGDVAAGTGVEFKDMALTIGKFSKGGTGEAIARFQELGILTRDELAAMGVQFSKSGELISPLPEATNAMLTIMKQKYGGLMEAQSGTFEGMMSNLSDWKAGVLRTIGAPIFEVLKEKLGDLLTILNSQAVQDGIASFATAIATGLGGFLEFIGDIVGPVVSFVGELVSEWSIAEEYTSSIWERIGAVLDTVFLRITEGIGPFQAFGIAVSGAFSSIIAFVQPFVDTILTAFSEGGVSGGVLAFLGTLGQISPTFALVKAAVEGALGPIQEIVTSVFGIISGFIQENGASIMTTVSTAWSTIHSIIQTVAGIVQEVVGTVFGLIAEFLKTHGDEIQAVLKTAWETIQSIINFALTFIQQIIVPALQAVAGFISAHSEEIKAVLDGAWSVIKGIIEFTMGIIKGIIDAVTAAINGDWSAAWEAIKTMLAGIWQGLQDIVSGALTIIQNVLSMAWSAITAAATFVWNIISAFFSSIWKTIKETFDSVVGGIQTFLSQTWDGILKTATELWESIKSAILAPIQAAYDAALKIAQTFSDIGDAIMGGITSGIVGATQAGIDAVTDAVNQLKDAGKTTADIHSPSRLFAMEVGAPIMDGVVAGILSKIEDAKAAASGAIRSIHQTAVGAIEAPAGGQVGATSGGWLPGQLAGNSQTVQGGPSTVITLHANYANQPEHSVADDIQMLQMLYGGGAA